MSNLSINISDKLGTLCIALLVTFTCLTFRLVYLQLYLQSDYQSRSKQNFLRLERISSRRGNILDHSGNLLATNRPVTSVYWKGSGNRQLTAEQMKQLDQLAKVIAIPVVDVGFLNAVKDAERFYRLFTLIEDISFPQLSKIMEQFPNDQNIIIETHLKRFYPHKELACHIIGYISNTLDYDSMGQMGLEKMFEELLKGQHGQLVKTINSVGVNLYQEEIKRALAGQDIVTTLNINLQEIAERAFPQGYAGALIIMNPKNGALYTVLSRPSFNPELFLRPIGSQDWKNIQLNRPFLNRAFNACYPPASLFKLVSLSAALETCLITPHTNTYCRGFIKFKGRKYRCNNKFGHGALNITQAVAQSCNPIFYDIAKKISINTLAEYANRFGLGQKTNIIFPESEGTVPNKEWKLRYKSEPWWPGETLSAIIGQSYLTVTPLQIACMIASIFQGYRVKPRILQNESIVCEPLLIKCETRDFLKSAMKSVVDEGTAISLRKIKNMQIYAKTGTAQIISMEENKETESQFLEHAWFAGYIQHEDGEPLMLVLLVEHAKSSKVATKIAKNFLMAYSDYMQQSISKC